MPRVEHNVRPGRGSGGGGRSVGAVGSAAHRWRAEQHKPTCPATSRQTAAAVGGRGWWRVWRRTARRVGGGAASEPSAANVYEKGLGGRLGGAANHAAALKDREGVGSARLHAPSRAQCCVPTLLQRYTAQDSAHAPRRGCWPAGSCRRNAPHRRRVGNQLWAARPPACLLWWLVQQSQWWRIAAGRASTSAGGSRQPTGM